MNDQDRFSRQRLLRWWSQERLSAARVLVAGAGALGNEVLKNLALLGVGSLVVIDHDRVETSNLSRAVLFTPDDVGLPKAQVVAGALRRLAAVAVRAITGDLFHDLGLGMFRHVNLAIGCVDSLAARSHLGRCCTLAGIPFLDGGMWALGGEARWFFAREQACFDCTRSADDLADERHSCSGFRDSEESTDQVPTLVTTAAIVGGLLAQEAVKYLCGRQVEAGRAIVYNGEGLTLHRADLPANPRCGGNHQPYRQVNERPWSAVQMTPRQVLLSARLEPGLAEVELAGRSNAPGVLELGRDVLVEFVCSGCGQRQEMYRILKQVRESERACPVCGTMRQARVISSLDETDPLAERTLKQLGVPEGEILAVRDSRGLWLYELTGDL